MITEAEITETGITAMTDQGRITVDFVDGVGRCSLVIEVMAPGTYHVPLDIDAVDHVQGVAQRAYFHALCSAVQAGTEPALLRRRLIPST